MDYSLYFIIAITMAFATWLIGKILGQVTNEAIITISTLAVILPLVIIYIIGVLGMMQEPESTAQIADMTIAALINYVTDNLLHIILFDVAGIIVGAVVGSFTR